MNKRYILIMVIVAAVLAVVLYRVKIIHAPVHVAPARTVSYSGDNASSSVIVEFPTAGSFISSPQLIRGKVKGWFFEASFPLILIDGGGLLIAQGVAHPLSGYEWTSPGFIPFEANLTFVTPLNATAFGNRGFLILKKDNPSGLPEHDASIEIPVQFK